MLLGVRCSVLCGMGWVGLGWVGVGCNVRDQYRFGLVWRGRTLREHPCTTSDGCPKRAAVRCGGGGVAYCHWNEQGLFFFVLLYTFISTLIGSIKDEKWGRGGGGAGTRAGVASCKNTAECKPPCGQRENRCNRDWGCETLTLHASTTLRGKRLTLAPPHPDVGATGEKRWTKKRDGKNEKRGCGVVVVLVVWRLKYHRKSRNTVSARTGEFRRCIALHEVHSECTNQSCTEEKNEPKNKIVIWKKRNRGGEDGRGRSVIH